MPTIKELREARGWTQLQMATRLGMRPETISYWENGHGKPSRLALTQLARVFRISIGEIELVEREESTHANEH